MISRQSIERCSRGRKSCRAYMTTKQCQRSMGKWAEEKSASQDCQRRLACKDVGAGRGNHRLVSRRCSVQMGAAWTWPSCNIFSHQEQTWPDSSLCFSTTSSGRRLERSEAGASHSSACSGERRRKYREEQLKNGESRKWTASARVPQ